MIKKIVIVGGGTAGWITASILIYKLNPKIKICLIESKEIPIVGVGESTTGTISQLIDDHAHLGGIKNFLKETGATYKYGIRHVDWLRKNHSFVSPIGSSFERWNKYPTKDYDHIRIYHVAEKLNYVIPLQNQLMLQDKLYYVKHGDKYQMMHDLDDGLHIDAFKTSEYFRKKCLSTGRITRIEDTIQNFTKNDFGGIKTLKLKSGKELDADLFIDCSGWHKTLIKDMGVDFVSYKNNLLTNRAILFPKKNKENDILKNHLTATARKHGWTFEIPLQERTGRGYIINRHMVSDDDAIKEMNECFNEEIEVKKTINFEVGRLNNFWVKNVLAVGLCSNFIEPLEATGLHTTIEQVEHFCDYYLNDTLDLYDYYLQKNYNDNITSFIDDIRDFILLHYQTKRTDTDFWIESSSKKRWTEEFKRKMCTWKKRMPRKSDYHHNGRFHGLSNALWLQVGHGYEIFDSEIAKKELEYYGLYDIAKQQLNEIGVFSKYCVDNAMTTNDFYKLLNNGKIN